VAECRFCSVLSSCDVDLVNTAIGSHDTRGTAVVLRIDQVVLQWPLHRYDRRDVVQTLPAVCANVGTSVDCL
jgi:hypothetical protein